MWVNIASRRYLQNHGNIATEGSPKSGLFPTLIEWHQGFFMVHSTIDRAVHSRHLNSLEHGICTTSMPNISKMRHHNNRSNVTNTRHQWRNDLKCEHCLYCIWRPTYLVNHHNNKCVMYFREFVNPCAAGAVYTWLQGCFRSIDISLNLIKYILVDTQLIKYCRYGSFTCLYLCKFVVLGLYTSSRNLEFKNHIW